MRWPAKPMRCTARRGEAGGPAAARCHGLLDGEVCARARTLLRGCAQ